MNIKWNAELAADDKFLDAQHVEIFQRIDNLITAVNIGRGKEEIRKILEFLFCYVAYHLEAEKKYMILNNYPETDIHITEHKKVIAELNNLRSELETNCSSPFITGIEERITLWFVNHIKKSDKSFTKFIKENK